MIKDFKKRIAKHWFKISYFAIGIGSIVWILIRIIPKPSRIHYPCMKATTPFAASFITYIAGLTTLSYFLRKARERFSQSKFLITASFLVAAIIAGAFSIIGNHNQLSANSFELAAPQAANEPIGVAKGIFPGRVVWIYNTEATDENCSNESDDYWWQDINTNQTAVNTMLSNGIQSLTGATTDQIAWDSIFHYYNRTHGRGNVGYTAGEKIVIKINLNGEYNNFTSTPPKNINTSPQICHAILDQLVSKAGVQQANISIGDPNVPMNAATYNKCHTTFPNVVYWQSTPTRSTNRVLINSDKTTENNYLPQAYLDADYMINIPVLKKHHRAGISLCSKNHFGSLAPYSDGGGAWHMHSSLPCPEATGVAVNGNYGVYRCFVDIMGHKDLGGKTILFLIDGIWGSTNWGHPPVKWRMSPFNSDWPNSIFLSQDPVAIESVGFDFLFEEFDETHPTEGEFVGDDKGPFPHFNGTDDFLQQAADPTLWASSIDYDPEDDNSILTSLGTHEHWNNATDKKYSRNLGTDNGIELYVPAGSVPDAIRNITDIPNGNLFVSNYPNPFSTSTKILFNLSEVGKVSLKIFDLAGKLVQFENLGKLESGKNEYLLYSKGLTKGSYICSIEVITDTQKFRMSRKIMVSN